MKQEVSDFKVGALFGQLIDRIPAILENAFVTIDEGDPALAGSRVHKGRIVGHQPKVIIRDFDLP